MAWFVPLIIGVTVPTSHATSVIVIGYILLALLSKFDARSKSNFLICIIMTLWGYQSCLILIGEIIFSNHIVNGIILAVPTILVSSAIIIASLDKQIICYIDMHPRRIVALSFIMATLPLSVSVICYGSLSLRNAVGVISVSIPVNYQDYGDWMVFIFCMALPVIQRNFCKLCMLLFISFSLFVLGSKAALVGVLISSFIVCMLYLIREKCFKKIIFGFFLLLVITCYLLMNKDMLYSLIPNEYHWGLNLIYERTKERSFYTRELLETYNMQTRHQRIVLGDYKYEFTCGSGAGTYTHNVIDYLDQYGIVYFVLLCLFYLVIYGQILFKFSKYNNRFYISALLLLTYWGILSIFVRSSHTNYAYLPLAIAVSILTSAETVVKRNKAIKTYKATNKGTDDNAVVI